MPTERKPFAPELPNIHPADELSAVREEIKILQRPCQRAPRPTARRRRHPQGRSNTAVIFPGTRETLDRKAITEAFGEAAVAPFLKKTVYQTVKLVEN